MFAQKRVAVICHGINNRVIFGFQRFQRHVHTYRILPDADGLLAVQVSVHRHWILRLARKKRGKWRRKGCLGTHCTCSERRSRSEGARGIKPWFVIVCCGRTGTCLCFLCLQPCCLNGISAMWPHACSTSAAAQRRNCFYVSEIPTQPTHEVSDHWVCLFVVWIDGGVGGGGGGWMWLQLKPVMVQVCFWCSEQEAWRDENKSASAYAHSGGDKAREWGK